MLSDTLKEKLEGEGFEILQVNKNGIVCADMDGEELQREDTAEGCMYEGGYCTEIRVYDFDGKLKMRHVCDEMLPEYNFFISENFACAPESDCLPRTVEGISLYIDLDEVLEMFEEENEDISFDELSEDEQYEYIRTHSPLVYGHCTMVRVCVYDLRNGDVYSSNLEFVDTEEPDTFFNEIKFENNKLFYDINEIELSELEKLPKQS